MKKLKTLSIILFFSVFFIVGFNYINSSNKPIDIPLQGSHEVFEYNEIVDIADVIALVQVKDELSESNSTVVYEENSPSIMYHYATREVEVLEYYKNDLDLGSNIKFNESAAITAQNEYLHVEEYTALQKGEKYIVYLSKNNGLNELSIISRNNGKINLDNFSENEFLDVAVKSILTIEGFEITEKAEVKFDIPEAKIQAIPKVNKLTNNYIDIPINYYFDEKSNLYYIDIDGLNLSISNTKLIN
ncbi:hypothetical protein [Lysinibacillus capsici]|uniref:hypothetical protein n=1 Tax=Lysinibacillus TaxID=400634 RepID=UPI0028A0397E|nr:hypothetical protein [Lysinibacillus capsici]